VALPAWLTSGGWKLIRKDCGLASPCASAGRPVIDLGGDAAQKHVNKQVVQAAPR